MLNYDKQALIELTKSVLRALWFGFLGLVSTALISVAASTDLMATTISFGDVMLQVGVFIAGGIGFAAKALDRYIHKSRNTKLNGIAPSFLQK